jgi:hypothetical protein
LAADRWVSVLRWAGLKSVKTKRELFEQQAFAVTCVRLRISLKTIDDLNDPLRKLMPLRELRGKDPQKRSCADWF